MWDIGVGTSLGWRWVVLMGLLTSGAVALIVVDAISVGIWRARQRR